jgi:hypothetical protein
MLYHESKCEGIVLDKEPLLLKHKREFDNLNLSSDISLYIDDYLMDTSSQLDENANLKFSSCESIDANSKCFLSNDVSNEIEKNLCGLFVVSFDTKQGNVIDWQIPRHLNLEQIEFKAMASGFHLTKRDHVYFRKDNMYGLAVFESIRIENSEERNVRMKSVGILAKSFRFLRDNLKFLRIQVK